MNNKNQITDIQNKLAKMWKHLFNIEEISLENDFFELGGNSLLGVRLGASVIMEFDVELPVDIFFSNPTLGDLAQYIESHLSRNKFVPISKVETIEYYNLSPAQKRMFILDKINPNSTTYNTMLCLNLGTAVEIPKIEESIRQTIRRHESLRTSFKIIEDTPKQIVNENFSFRLEHYTISSLEIEKYKEQFDTPFNLSNDLLIRGMVLTLSESKENYLFLNIHHIVIDGSSVAIILKDFAKAYNGNPLNPIRLQYKDYANWQEEQQKQEGVQKQIDYWIERIGNDPPVLNLPLDFPRPSVKNHEGDVHYFKIDNILTKKIDGFAHANKMTPFMVLLSVVNILLSKYSRQEDIIVGTPIAGRPHVELQDMVGMFVNMMPMRNQPEKNKTFKEFLLEVRQNSFDAFENQDCQFDILIEKIGVKSNASGNPLFNVVFVAQNMDIPKIKLGDFATTPKQIKNKTSKFDLTFEVMQIDDFMECMIEYDTQLFKKSTIQRFSEKFVHCINEVIKAPNKKITDIDFLTAEEKNMVIYEFNSTNTKYPRDKTVAQLFEEQTAKTPNKTAIVFEKQELTYAQLNTYADCLAQKLIQEYDIQPNDFIAISTEKSLELIVGILAIVKSGAAYVFIDPDYPEERIQFILKDCQPNAILTKQEITLNENSIKNINYLERQQTNKPTDTICVIYTSGSMGYPKGALTCHRNVVRLVKNTNYIHLDKDTRLLQAGSISFDASTFEIWGPLLNGGTVYFEGQEIILDPAKLKQSILSNNINTLFLTTSLCHQMIENDSGMFSSLSYLIAGGEKISESHVRMLRRNDGKPRFTNVYGPTENTTFTTYYHMPNEFTRLLIGKPVSNTQVYILNGDEICCIGAIGELCTTGDGVVHGYLNRPELTAEKFVTNPFGAGKMYRTGDLARWLPNGNIEFLGRVDGQVKIRGFRIEPGEIETRLIEQTGISAAAVIAQEGKAGGQQLCAYIVGNAEIDVEIIKTELRKVLPNYMIPTYIMQIDNIPLTRNGKLDRAVLPIPEYKARTYAMPTNQNEELVVKAFKEVSLVDDIGLDDSFYDIGGDSLKAFRLVSIINDKRINVRTIIEKQTARNIAVVMSNCPLEEHGYVNIDSMVHVMNDNTDIDDAKAQIFLIPPGTGYATVEYKKLVDRMNYKGRIFGVNDPKYNIHNIDEGINNLCLIPDPLEYTFQETYKGIKEKFKDGDILIGYCYGGLILPEVVHRLERDGYIVSKIIVLDRIMNESDFITPDKINDERIFEMGKMFVDLITNRPYSPDEHGITLDSIALGVSRFFSGTQSRENEQIHIEVKKMLSVFLLNATLNVVFRSKIKADIFAVFTEDTLRQYKELCFNWKTYTTGNFAYHTIDCDHFELVTHFYPDLAPVLLDWVNR